MSDPTQNDVAPPAQIGIVYYSDDPDKKVFRYVMPSPGDPPDVLDWPRWVGQDPDDAVNQPCDVSRGPVMIKIAQDTPFNNTGTPDAPPTTNGLDASGNPWPPVEN